jgi:hypothetical protein
LRVNGFACVLLPVSSDGRPFGGFVCVVCARLFVRMSARVFAPVCMRLCLCISMCFRVCVRACVCQCGWCEIFLGGGGIPKSSPLPQHSFTHTHAHSRLLSLVDENPAATECGDGRDGGGKTGSDDGENRDGSDVCGGVVGDGGGGRGRDGGGGVRVRVEGRGQDHGDEEEGGLGLGPGGEGVEEGVMEQQMGLAGQGDSEWAAVIALLKAGVVDADGTAEAEAAKVEAKVEVEVAAAVVAAAEVVDSGVIMPVMLSLTHTHTHASLHANKRGLHYSNGNCGSSVTQRWRPWGFSAVGPRHMLEFGAGGVEEIPSGRTVCCWGGSPSWFADRCMLGPLRGARTDAQLHLNAAAALTPRALSG